VLGDGGSVTLAGGLTPVTPGGPTLTATDLGGGVGGCVIVTLQDLGSLSLSCRLGRHTDLSPGSSPDL
jgi:hypothetical protein